MSKTIIQEVIFKSSTPKELYSIYMDAKKHSAAIGAGVTIQNKEGNEYTAHDGYIWGKNLQLIKNKLIVQSWRSSDFKKGELDSTFILQFEQRGKDTLLTMVHANLPDHQYVSVKKGWDDYYWKPWKKYLENKNRK